MPRNRQRKRTPPTTLIRARVVRAFRAFTPSGDDYLDHAVCGRCGQSLWALDRNRDRLELIGPGHVSGWRFSEGTWRPTAEHRLRRRRAEQRLQDPTEPGSSKFADRERLRSNAFGRDPKISKITKAMTTMDVAAYVETGYYRPREFERDGKVCKGVEVIDISERSARLRHAFDLPAKIECPRCNQVNEVCRVCPVEIKHLSRLLYELGRD